MRFLVLLMLLAGCGTPKPTVKYEVGDCVRIVTRITVSDFYVRQIIEDKYIMSSAFKLKGVPSFLNSKYVFTFEELERITNVKIDCSEVE
jgi:hypothetical protein